jgi:NADH-quinone oxidoreductase subunit L
MDVVMIFLPLVAAAIAGLFWRHIGDRGAQLVTCAALLVSMVLAWIVFFDVGLHHGVPRTTEIFTWFLSGGFQAHWAISIDQLTAVMLIVVTTVSAMVHIYSIGYMHGDPSIPRFMSYLSLFTFFMLMLITADNFMQLFFGWEGVGLCSYLLVGFWYQRPSANAAAIKAFVVTRVGDFGFMLGIMGVYFVFKHVEYVEVFKAAPAMAGTTIEFLGMRLPTMETLCILLFIGAMGKSAQIGLHTWLPDAMEGPTPVSALIHAATMVTAGVFMVCRLSPMFEYAPFALTFVTVIGAVTCLFAATIGFVQNDIKRVIAYSTCSQLGYMFLAAGVSAYGAAIFHLFTHAFFKSLLFLGSGCVIHAMSGEQDMRKMGGLWRMIPITYVLMWAGSLALGGIGIPGVFGFAGFYSKDMILEAAWGSGTAVGHFGFWLGALAAGGTGFYTWRLLFMTFHGTSRADHETLHHVHESPKVMWMPLIPLALGAAFAGIVFYPVFVGHDMADYWRQSLFVLPGHDSIEAGHNVPEWVSLAPLILGLGGIGLAFVMYILRPSLPAAMARAFRPIYLLFLNKWYFDELYDFLFVNAAKRLGHLLWKGGDGSVIDGLGPDGVASVTRNLAQRAGRLQTGYVYHYAFAMLIGVVLIISWYLFWGAR